VIFSGDVGVLRVIGRTNQIVFGPGNSVVDGIGLVQFVIEPQPFDDVFEHAAAVLRVVDGEVGGVIDALAFNAQNAGEDTVKSAHPYVAPANAVFHFAGRLVRKRERQDGEWIHPLVDEVGDTVRQYTGLSGTCSRDNHHGSFYLSCCGLLRLIQSFQHLHYSNVAGLASNTLSLSTP